jgi:hypothetical protein
MPLYLTYCKRTNRPTSSASVDRHPCTGAPKAHQHACALTCLSARLSQRCASSASGATPADPLYRARPYSSWPSRWPALAARRQKRIASSGQPAASYRRAHTTSADTLPSLAACKQKRRRGQGQGFVTRCMLALYACSAWRRALATDPNASGRIGMYILMHVLHTESRRYEGASHSRALMPLMPLVNSPCPAGVGAALCPCASLQCCCSMVGPHPA